MRAELPVVRLLPPHPNFQTVAQVFTKVIFGNGAS